MMRCADQHGPHHEILVTEEAMFVVSGSAKVRTAEGLTPIGPGDFISFLPGSRSCTSEPPRPGGMDIVEYPDSDKVASVVGFPPDATRFMFKKSGAAGYFDGEKDAE